MSHVSDDSDERKHANLPGLLSTMQSGGSEDCLIEKRACAVWLLGREMYMRRFKAWLECADATKSFLGMN